MKASKAQQRTTNKYNARAYDRIASVVPRVAREQIKDFAERHGDSVSNFTSRLIIQAMQQEGEACERPPKNERE